MTVPIQDAASLILIDSRDTKNLKVVMGQRSASMTFMPEVYVFPGGRVDPEDATSMTASLQEATYQSLHSYGGAKSKIHANALAIAAIRETREEVGLHIEQHTAHMESLIYLSRATTPEGRPRRYDTRFFILDAAKTTLSGSLTDSNELCNVDWYTFEQIESLKTARITRVIMQDLKQALDTDILKKTSTPIWQPPHHQSFALSTS